MDAKIIEPLAPFAVPIDSIRPRQVNPRSGDVEAMARSLTRFGQRRLVVVNEATGEIEAGNHLWLAANELGWSHVAAVHVHDDPETEAGYVLADNRIAELGSMQTDIVALMVRDLTGYDDAPDLLDAAGYDADDVADLLADLDDVADDVGALADPGKTPKQREQSYESSGVRSILLPYGLADFTDVTKRLAVLRARFDVESNAEAIKALLAETVTDDDLTALG